MTAPTTAPTPQAMPPIPRVKTKAEKIADLQSYLQARVPNLKAIAARHISPDRLIKVLITAVSRVPDLLDCTPTSLFLALMQAADLGLEPNTPLQLAAIVPFAKKGQRQKEAQLLPMYRGLIRLALQSGEVVSIMPRVVYEKDTFEIAYGTNERIDHKPHIGLNPGAAVGYYAIATMKDGTRTFDFMTRARVETIKARSQGGSSESSPWSTDFDEMGLKSSVKHLCKYLSLSSEKFAAATAHDDRASAGEAPDYSDILEASGEVLPESHTPEVEAAIKAQDFVAAKQGTDRAREAVKARAAEIKHGQQQMPLGEKE